MRLTALAVAAGLLWPACAFSAGFVTSNDLYERCNAQSGTVEHGFCLGYLAGIADQVNSNDMTICIPLPDGVTLGQVTDIVVKALREHRSQQRHGSASALAEWALREAFPCKEQAH